MNLFCYNGVNLGWSPLSALPISVYLAFSLSQAELLPM